MKFAICNEMFHEVKWEIEKQFDVAAEVGFEGIEIAPFTLAGSVRDITQEQRERIRQASASTGVAPCGIHWLLAGTTGYHVTDPDPAVREATVKYCEDLVRFALEIGAEYQVVGSPGQRTVKRDEGVTYQQAWEWFKEAMVASAQVEGAGSYRVAIEPLAATTNNNFLFNHLEVIKMCREINLPNVGVILDTYSGLQTESNLPDAIRETGDLLFHYHCNDINKRAPGLGDTDFVPVMRALLDIDYPWYASIEVFDFSPDPMEQCRVGLATLQDALAAAS
ncbi:MAG TPA: sugar phosphate isomerase/epimerase family protein [Armatimonadota bacterium]|nr:sugar phosphate isomerase/epimerase family protein [Armatimonadota bacterium]